VTAEAFPAVTDFQADEIVLIDHSPVRPSAVANGNVEPDLTHMSALLSRQDSRDS
jgi:hypothetical protein